MLGKRTLRIFFRLLVGGIVVAGAAIVLVHWMQRALRPYQAASTRRMAERLGVLAESADLEENLFLNDARVKLFEDRLVLAIRPDETASISMTLARELLRAGQTEQAIETIEGMLDGIVRGALPAGPGQIPELQDMLAISYMRLGEQQNCIHNHGVDSCLFPIQGTGIHILPQGSRGAIQVYERLLAMYPEDLGYRWLLNVAYNTLGEHPQKVPSQWLIPQEVLASDYEIKRFYDIAPRLGLDVMGLSGGSMMEDFDGDGYLDIMASSYGFRDQLRYFRNNADGTFTDRTVDAGLTGMVGGLNLCQADYNNDGYPDVLVLRGGWFGRGGVFPNSLLRNNGDGTFDDVTEVAGILSFHPTQTASWGDYNNDGWLDLLIGNESVDGFLNPCELYHNNGDGTFTECAEEQGLDIEGFVKAVVWGDYDNDGFLDLFVSRLTEPNLLLRNEGPVSDREALSDATRASRGSPVPRWLFRDVTEEAGVREPLKSFPSWFWDYDNDGWLDLFVADYGWTSVGDAAADYLGIPHAGALPKLYRNRRDGTFEDVTRAANVEKLLLAMGSNFGDLDNDGYLDFYIGTGEPSLTALIPNRMFRNAGDGSFQDVTVSGGFGHLQKGHGVAFGDLDNDGDQDIYTVMGGAFTGDGYQNVLFHNPGHGNHWITLKLEGVRSNRMALGARIRIRVNAEGTQRDIYATVSSGGSFGCSSLQQEMGLGKAESIAEIEITWPASGSTQTFRNVAMDQILKVREGDPNPVPVVLKRLDFSATEPPKDGSHHHHGS